MTEYKKIEVKNLGKKYGGFEAVRDISFSVGKEQVLGFLGPNGAGKTTVMKILAGSHFPSSGVVKIDGFSVTDNPVEAKRRIGYLSENVPLYGDMSAKEYLYFAASARLLPKAQRQKAVDSAISACGLEGYENKRIETLSKGYRQRAGLAQAIVHDPPILVLDEPTSGLDPNQIIEIRSLIRELGRRKTVILSTHILREVEAVCSSVLILDKGRIAARGTPEEIAGSLKGRAGLEVFIKGAPRSKIEAGLASLPQSLKISAVTAETLKNGTVKLLLSCGVNESDEAELLFDWAVSRGYKITGMNRKVLSLEDMFVKLTNEPPETVPRVYEALADSPSTDNPPADKPLSGVEEKKLSGEECFAGVKRRDNFFSPRAAISRIFAVTGKELRSWIKSPALYGITVFFLLFLSIWLFYLQRFFAMDSAGLRPFFSGFPVAFILVIPVLTMKVWAEEKKQGSIELLFTLPFTEWELVCGKFISCFALLLCMICLTLPVPLTLLPLGHFDSGVIIGEYAGAVFLASSAVALGLFLSSVSKTQVTSFLGSAVILMAVMLVNNFTQDLPAFLSRFLNYFSLSFHFESFSKGLLDSRDLAFFVLSTVLFLFINTQVLIYKKWK